MPQGREGDPGIEQHVQKKTKRTTKLSLSFSSRQISVAEVIDLTDDPEVEQIKPEDSPMHPEVEQIKDEENRPMEVVRPFSREEKSFGVDDTIDSNTSDCDSPVFDRSHLQSARQLDSEDCIIIKNRKHTKRM